MKASTHECPGWQAAYTIKKISILEKKVYMGYTHARLVYLITWHMWIFYARHHSPSIEYDSNTCMLSFEMKDFNVGCKRFAAVCHLQLSDCKRVCFNQRRPMSCVTREGGPEDPWTESYDVHKHFWGRVCSTMINSGVCSCYPWSSSLLYLVIMHRHLLMSWTNHVMVHHCEIPHSTFLNIGGQNQRVMQVSFFVLKKDGGKTKRHG